MTQTVGTIVTTSSARVHVSWPKRETHLVIITGFRLINSRKNKYVVQDRAKVRH